MFLDNCTSLSVYFISFPFHLKAKTVKPEGGFSIKARVGLGSI